MKTLKKIICDPQNKEPRYVIEVTINGVNPNFHKVSITGHGYHQEQICSTSTLEDAVSKMEYDAYVRLKPSFQVEDEITENLIACGFEEEKDAEIIKLNGND